MSEAGGACAGVTWSLIARDIHTHTRLFLFVRTVEKNAFFACVSAKDITELHTGPWRAKKKKGAT